MDFNDDNAFGIQWSVERMSVNGQMEGDWSETDLLTGYCGTDFEFHQMSSNFEYSGVGNSTNLFEFSYDHCMPLTPDSFTESSAFDVFNVYSELLNAPPPYQFVNTAQLQLPMRPSLSFNMGQESSQMAPPTANNPLLSAPRNHRPLNEQSPSRREQAASWRPINRPKNHSQLQPPAEVNSSRRDPRKTKRKRVKEEDNVPAPSQHPSKAKATRTIPKQIQSPSPSPTDLSVASSVAEQFPEATSSVHTPASDDSENIARSPISSEGTITEESEPETTTDVEAAPALKRRKMSRTAPTPTPSATPVVNGKRVPKSRGRARASASGSPRSRASPAQPNKGKRLRQQQNNAGRYTDEEIGRLEKAVSTYRDDHNLTQQAINDLLNSNARANDFPGGLWDSICEALPHRERHSVQKAVKRKFNNRKRGTWTPEDDEELCALYEIYQNQWQRIGEENNRGAEASRDRWRNYCKNGSAQEKGEWTLAEEKRLVQLMRDTVQVLVQERVRDIKAGKPVAERFEPGELMDFGVLSEKMGGTRSRLQCRNKYEKFKKRDTSNLNFIKKPMQSLDGLEFEAITQQATRKSQAKSRKSGARMSEEAEALRNYNEKMLVGDKYNILLGIQKVLIQTGITDETSIPWDDVIEADNQLNWSILDRKVVLQRMQLEYPSPEDESSCIDIVTGITEILESEYVDDPETLEMCCEDRPRSNRKHTYSKKLSRARNSISAIKIADKDDDESPARSLPTPGSMEDDDDDDDEEEDGV